MELYESAASLYDAGVIVQLRSGGPLLTTGNTRPTGMTNVIYYNSISGLFERSEIDERCLRHAALAPMAPEGADRLRHTSVTKSSLS